MFEGVAVEKIAVLVMLLGALVLAWRAYRGAAEDHERRKREKERRDGRD
jgi:hypothetical protein